MVLADLDCGIRPRATDVILPELRRRGFDVPPKAQAQVVRSTIIENYRRKEEGRP
jgi:hypothetical protein